jgi:DNA invertase Pin-like site-specific DNA recombinase
MSNKPTTICALYTRVSSRNQLDIDYSSMQTQRERLEAYCRSQDNYEIYRVKFVSITQSLDTQHPMGRLLRNILLDFA